MEVLFAQSHGTLEQINTLFIQLERHLGHADEIEQTHFYWEQQYELANLRSLQAIFHMPLSWPYTLSFRIGHAFDGGLQQLVGPGNQSRLRTG